MLQLKIEVVKKSKRVILPAEHQKYQRKARNSIDYVRRLIINVSRRMVIVLADSKKFNILSYYKCINWDQIDVIITNKKPPLVFLDIMEENNIELIIT